MPKKLLIIDDDPDDIDFFQEAAYSIDPSLQFSKAINGEEALKLLQSATNIPDFIILDLNMPRLNGKEFLAEINKDQRLKKIPVIIYSTSSLEKDIQETKSLGAVHFIVKPVRLSDLKERIGEVMRDVND